MFNTKKFLADTYGNADGVCGIFGAYRMDIPPRDTVRKWFERSSVPSDWFPVLVAVMELERGEPIGLANYLTGGTNG
jgi:hypothetical protein